jgi:exopolysaccharide production protein ExoF
VGYVLIRTRFYGSVLSVLLTATSLHSLPAGAQTTEPKSRQATTRGESSDAAASRAEFTPNGQSAERAGAPEGRTKEVVKSRAFEMSAVELLRLRVPDLAEMSGEYRVDAEAAISLPGLGRMRIGGMSPEAFEREISRKVSAFVRRDLTVSVEVQRFKPYFMIGMVADPGASEWTPGLNVLKAVALAGGTVRPATAADDPVAALATHQSQTQLQFSLALLARMKAERDGSASVEPAEHVSSIIAAMPASVQPRLKEFLARQNAVLDEQRALLQGQIAGFERDRQAAANELQTASQQEKSIKAQLDISTSLLNDVEQLKDQKLVTNTRYLTQRSDLISSQIRYGEAQSMMERARARMESITRQIENLQRERRATLNDRIEALQREVAQIEVNLLPVNVGAGERRPAPSNLVYHIARETENGVVTDPATVFSEVLPGDVVVVSMAEQQAPSSMGVTSATVDELQRAIETSSAAQSSSGRGGSRGRANPR